MFKGFLSGLVWGGMVGAVVLAVLSLYAPLPEAQADAGAGDDAPAAAPALDQVEPADTSVVDTLEPVEAPKEDAPTVEPANETDQDETDQDETDQPVDDAQSGALDIPADVPTAASEAAQAEVTIADVQDDTAASAIDETTPSNIDVETADVSPEVAETAELPSFYDTTDITNVKLPQISAESLEQVDTLAAPIIGAVEPVPSDRPLVLSEKPIEALPVQILHTAPDSLGFGNGGSDRSDVSFGSINDTAPSTATTTLPAPVISELPPTPVKNPSEIQVAELTLGVSNRLPQVGVSQDPTPTDVSAETPIGVEVEPIENPVSDSTGNVIVGRLPTVGATPELSTDASVPVTTPEVDTPSQGALADFSVPFETKGQSLFSVVIVDSGEAGVAREQLLNSSYPITVALDPSAPDASAVMSQYRAAGIEVVALLNDLPLAASPSDVEVAVGGYFNVLNEAVAVMEPLDRRLQTNRDLLPPVLGAISASGHGFMTYAEGLNTTQQSATRVGVPSVSIFRVLDDEGEQAPKIKRYLKRAAFNAGRDGSVVVVGRSYSETMTAILEWALENNDASISLAPVSAILKNDLAKES